MYDSSKCFRYSATRAHLKLLRILQGVSGRALKRAKDGSNHPGHHMWPGPACVDCRCQNLLCSVMHTVAPELQYRTGGERWRASGVPKDQMVLASD